MSRVRFRLFVAALSVAIVTVVVAVRLHAALDRIKFLVVMAFVLIVIAAETVAGFLAFFVKPLTCALSLDCLNSALLSDLERYELNDAAR